MSSHTCSNASAQSGYRLSQGFNVTVSFKVASRLYSRGEQLVKISLLGG